MADRRLEALQTLLAQMKGCRTCPKMHPPVVVGPAVLSPVLIVGQAPGVREGPADKLFAWTAGKTLFRWFHQALGLDEAAVRSRIAFAAVARCFPGKLAKGGDRKPDADEVLACRPWLAAQVALVQPRLVVPLGSLAIEQVLGHTGPLAAVVGRLHAARWHEVDVEVLPLPHPSGVSTWPVTEPGKTLLARALERLGQHPVARSLQKP
ncbi:MAG: uracil-DNA glycosylase family protein [Myxococcaceae bacterium]|nr:uracil-DNA glycosylase family protein [Myxococcaceae bacterium]